MQVIVKWQRAEKKWMDGSFLDLDAEVIEAEVDEYWREIYKIQKQFNNKLKKLTVRDYSSNNKPSICPTSFNFYWPSSKLISNSLKTYVIHCCICHSLKL